MSVSSTAAVANNTGQCSSCPANNLITNSRSFESGLFLSGIAHGFDIGFLPQFHVTSARKNKDSATAHPEIVDVYLQNEVSLGQVALAAHYLICKVSSFGMIAKTGQPVKWRLILDLLSPHGCSVNDGIDPEQFSLQYIKFDEVVAMVTKLGRGALMAKYDVQSAYHNVAVLPSQRHLLGMKWRGKLYIDLALPFGLRSAPFIFNSMADAIEWILHDNYAIVNLMHYLDDYITAGPPHLPQCAHNLAMASNVCSRLSVPFHNLKPVSIKVYLSAVQALYRTWLSRPLSWLSAFTACGKAHQTLQRWLLKISVFQLHRTFLARSIAAWTLRSTMTFCSGPLAVWHILVSCDHPSLLYPMALPILCRFTYPIMMLLLTEDSIRLVFKCLSKYLKPIPFGCTLTLGRSPLCPVESLLSYLEIRGVDGPLFVRSNGAPLTCTVFTERLRRLLSQAGITGHFGSRSFRTGAATTTGLAGVPEQMIQTLG